MAKSTFSWMLAVSLLALLSGAAGASSLSQGNTVLDRDTTYEQNLRWEASNDKTITPQKVIRWMLSMRGQTLTAPPKTEFQPIVNAHDGQMLFVAAIAYKF